MELQILNKYFIIVLVEITFAIAVGSQRFSEYTSFESILAPIELSDVIFTLHTRKAQDGYRIIPSDSLSLQLGFFDPNNPVIMSVHSQAGNASSEPQKRLLKAHTKMLDVNYFTVDWSKCEELTQSIQPKLVSCILRVGGFIADFIKFLTLHGGKPYLMQLIGHGMGAHAVAQVPNYRITVARITGLDPSNSLFEDRPDEDILDSNDATFVDVIHTDSFSRSSKRRMGHSDFFPNGGMMQPSCSSPECSRDSAAKYYASSLYHITKYPGRRCPNIEAANLGECYGPTAYMGVLSSSGPRGIYHVSV